MAALVFCGLTSVASATDWTFHFDAEKGDRVVTIPYDPQPLEAYLFRHPQYSSDPLTTDARIVTSFVEQIGGIDDHTVIAAKSFVDDVYYTNVFLVLVRVDSGRFIPCFGVQYHSGTREPRLTDSSWRSDGVSLEYTVFYSGTGGHRVVYGVEVFFDDGGRPKVVTKEKTQKEDAQALQTTSMTRSSAAAGRRPLSSDAPAGCPSFIVSRQNNNLKTATCQQPRFC